MIIEKPLYGRQDPVDEWVRYDGRWNRFALGMLNSATKYPSILTYHEMGERGRLNSELTETDIVSDDPQLQQIHSKYIANTLRYMSPRKLTVRTPESFYTKTTISSGHGRS
jgi:hypothetical protein